MKRRKKQPQPMKPFGWIRDRWRCDFCGRRMVNERVKMTHSSGMVFFACVPCGMRPLGVVGGLGGTPPVRAVPQLGR